jgi:enamine deaminase RidA (YjgF/YER057c/UK114 family)
MTSKVLIDDSLETEMKKKVINPWRWQDRYGFAQAIEVDGAQRFLLCAGQTSVDADGNPLHKGDMIKQVNQALDNLETLLKYSDMTLADAVHFKYFTTNIPAFIEAHAVLDERLKKARCARSSTLIGVTGLFHPDILVEIEAIAAI